MTCLILARDSNMPIADVNGIRMNYCVAGEGDPVVLITGFGGTLEFWNKMVPLLSDDYMVVTFDNRGSGRTEYQGDFTKMDLIRDVVALMDHLRIFRAHVLGWSMGGHIAQGLALYFPERVRTLTLVSTYLRRPARSSYMMNAIVDAGREGMDPHYIGAMINAFCFTEEYFLKKEAAGCRVRAVAGDPEGLHRQMKALDTFDSRHLAKDIRAPTLNIHGLEDIMVEPKEGDRITDLVPGCRRYRVPGAGHIIDPELYVDVFKRHLAGSA